MNIPTKAKKERFETIIEGCICPKNKNLQELKKILLNGILIASPFQSSQ